MQLEIKKALPVDVFCNRTNPKGCTNKGVSSTRDDFYIISERQINLDASREVIPYDFSGHINVDSDSEKVLVILEFKTRWGLSLRAVPYDLYVAKKWVQFGGNFIYTSDSRFPSDSPIKIFDRVE